MEWIRTPSEKKKNPFALVVSKEAPVVGKNEEDGVVVKPQEGGKAYMHLPG